MTDDIVTQVRKQCGCQWMRGDEVPCLPCRVADEIERLRATIGGWSQDISNLQDEVEQLRKQVEDCENDFEILSQIFNEVRAERDQMKAEHD